MRLKTFLNESNTQSKQIIDNVIKKGLQNDLKNNINSVDSIIDVLDKYFNKHEIYFEKSNATGNVKNLIVVYAQLTTDCELIININPRETLKYLKKNIYNNDFNDLRKNKFLKEIYLLMVHELKHLQQFKKNKKLFKNMPDTNDMQAYLSDWNEIDAYALQTVEELKLDKTSKVIQMYLTIFDKDHPTIDKLLNRITYYEDLDKN